MANQNAKMIFLQIIHENEGRWGWYQFERAFPPGWFRDEDPTTTAKMILDRLKAEGLATATEDSFGRYRLTEEGLRKLQSVEMNFVPG